MERADIAIIGTGPGGVSAALTAKVRNKNILLIGKKQMSDKVSKAHQIMNYPGLPAVTGADMAKAFEKQLAMMEINITDSRIGTVYAMGDYFAIQAGGEVLEAKSVILACGVVSGKTLPGEDGVSATVRPVMHAFIKERRLPSSVTEKMRNTKPIFLRKWQQRYFIFQCIRMYLAYQSR